ncbi:cytochrome-c peroxidase [Paraburkholderia sp. CNPSo 3272]|uniref:cytochrome-c peroxidase n=1 Tax=Paraburkholderia sp. CNPSo 3272 TaxID=2940931 RepID=UPI0020B771D9|nr:cytochrome c peroxidase [Paraburkholderia sp. CNPSo 3272]MCP3721945.1 cytochrome-c peroxidase [Paraburkholderia sp. CNPSo 3272]
MRHFSSRAVLATALCVCLLSACDQHAPDAQAATVEAPAPDLAAIGKAAFFDPSLSASGKQSCASCHSPANAYGPPNGLAVQFGGPNLDRAGLRSVPSLRYLRAVPYWTFTQANSLKERLEDGDNQPSGGYTWDGRYNTPADQAAFPLLNPDEMANSSADDVAQKLSKSAYAQQFRQAFGQDIFSRPAQALVDLGKVLQAFQFNDSSFAPYSSKFDRVLDGRDHFTPQEAHGLVLFSDPDKGNCASCHLINKGAHGAHPALTDYNFQTLGVPRNTEIPANRDPNFFDMGLCGPLRQDEAKQQKWFCGMFRTPTLRNVATRRVFFHNGMYHTLEVSLRFYVERDTNPEKWYSKDAHGHVVKFDDLPKNLRSNVDTKTEPLTNHLGGKPVWSDSDIRDVMAFLDTLTDADAKTVPR